MTFLDMKPADSPANNSLESCVHSHTLMNPKLTAHCPPIIHSPQPKRPLKRRVWEEEETDYYQNCLHKRQRLASSPAVEIIVRSRSDSFLPSTMSSRPSREHRPPTRYEGVEITRPRTHSGARDSALPPSPSQSPASLVSFSVTSTPMSAPLTPSTSFDQGYDARANSRTSQPTYRHDLLRNGIEIDPDQVSAPVLQYAQEILRQARTSPGLSESEAQDAVKHMRLLRQSADENTVKEGYRDYKIMPGALATPGITRGSDCPFDSTALPRVPMAPPLAVPKPDYYYSFSENSFDNEQDAKQSSRTLRPYSRPSTAGSWPFFIVEFKSQTRGGTFWVAENQAATSGSLCVNSMEELLSLVEDKTTEIDSIVFSCTMDAKSAAFWVHYCNQERDRYFSIEVEQFSMANSTDVIQCRNRIRNIMSWAIGARLPKILATLNEIDLTSLHRKDKQQRVRRGSASIKGASSKRRS